MTYNDTRCSLKTWRHASCADDASPRRRRHRLAWCPLFTVRAESTSLLAMAACTSLNLGHSHGPCQTIVNSSDSFIHSLSNAGLQVTGSRLYDVMLWELHASLSEVFDWQISHAYFCFVLAFCVSHVNTLKQNNFTETKHCFAFVLFQFYFSFISDVTTCISRPLIHTISRTITTWRPQMHKLNYKKRWHGGATGMASD